MKSTKQQIINDAISFYMKRFGEQADPIDALRYYVGEGQVNTNDRGLVNEIFHDEGLIDGGNMKIEDREKELEQELYNLTHQVYTPSRKQVQALEERLQRFREKYGIYKQAKPAPLQEKANHITPKEITTLNKLIKVANVRLNEARLYIQKVEEKLISGNL